MPEPNAVETCRWSRLTIRTPYPYWLAAEDRPWSCLCAADPKTLADPALCRQCERWTPHRLDPDLPEA